MIHHTSKAAHRLLLLGMGILVVTSCLLATAAWRLAQGPIELGWLADRVKAALVDDRDSTHVSFDRVFLVWEGFDRGVDHPLDLRLTDIVVTDPAGRQLVAAPDAHLTFSLAGLALGRIVPRAIEVDHAQIAVTREVGGAIDLGQALAAGGSSETSSSDLRQLLEQLSRPASSDHGRTHGVFDQLQRVHLRDTEVMLRDQASGLVVGTSDMDLDLARARTGHVRGLLRAGLRVGGEQAGLTANTDWTVGSGATLTVALTPLRPAGVGSLPPALAGIDVPLSFTATVGFDATFMPTRLRADILVGTGHIQVGQGSVPIRSGSVALSGTPAAITVSKGHFDVAHTRDGSPEIVDISGIVVHQSDRLSATVAVGLEQIDIADLPRLWPPGVGGGARPWVTEHVTGGVATHGTGSFVIEADDALRDAAVTKATADLDGSNATFTWIDNVPPVEQTEVHLHLADADTLEIHVASARQRVRNGAGDLAIRDGQMRITGLSLRDQVAVIRTQIEGPVVSALALLKEPRLHLLSTHPIALKVTDGDASATLDLQFPLENRLQIDDVQIHADTHLTGVKLPDVAAGQTLDGGVFDLSVGKDGLTLKGQGAVAAIPVSVGGTMDFSPGPADQVVQKITVTGQPSGAQLAAGGVAVGDYLDGPIPLTIVLTERRGGDGSVAVSGDLTAATLSIHPLAWTKAPGSAASASATLLLSHDRLTKLDKIAVRGDGLLVTGAADFADGHIRSVLFDTVRVGQTRGRGTVSLVAGQPITVALQGDQIDLSGKLTEKMSGGDRPDAPQVTTPAWGVDARFDRAILANGESARGVQVTASGGGALIQLLSAAGTIEQGGGFSIKIEPRSGKRHLLIDAKDAGQFLLGVDVVKGMRSGHLAVDAELDSPFGLYPMTGAATIDDVVVRNSPALGKLLQAITLYGLVDALRGPGMGFSRIVVPFRYDGINLNVDEAHAYNPSLGLTANGRIGLASGQTSISGTIVPAYFFNSMLGQLPVLGKLFVPEKGGGVFAARFGLEGKIDDPSVSINPVSALTPGFLRGIFGVFDRGGTAERK